MRVQLISKSEPSITGMSRYTQGLYGGLQSAGLDVRLTFPSRAPIPGKVQHGLHRIGMDVQAFFASYPFRANLDGADVYHLTGQMLATLLLLQRFPKPVVVTVLDIIPFLVRHIPKLNTFRHRVDDLFYRMALTGLRRADMLIAISEYTKRTLIDALGISPKRIHVIYPAVDHKKFHEQIVPLSFYSKYGLNASERYILFVGSEDPRKNLGTGIRAFAKVKQEIPNVKLLKVGAFQFANERQRLLKLIAEFNLERDVLLLNYVPDEDLPLIYNMAEICLLPSLYEGFGLPMLEAMASGTPVVCARTGPLPEVVGDCGMQVNPDDVDTFADAMLYLLNNEAERIRLKCAGHERAAQFTWERTACETQRLYQSVME